MNWAGLLKVTTCATLLAASSVFSMANDTFDTDLSQWTQPGAFGSAGDGVFNVSGGALDYTTGAGGSMNDFASITSLQTVANTGTWSATIDVQIDPSLTGSQQFVELGLAVSKTGEIVDNASSQLVLNLTETTSTWKSFENYFETNSQAAVTSLGSIEIAYDGVSSLTYSYLDDGGSWQVLGTADISGWAMTNTDSFTFSLTSWSGSTDGSSLVVATGKAQMDNFQLTATPEPTTIVMMVLGMGLVLASVYSRRQRLVKQS